MNVTIEKKTVMNSFQWLYNYRDLSLYNIFTLIVIEIRSVNSVIFKVGSVDF